MHRKNPLQIRHTTIDPKTDEEVVIIRDGSGTYTQKEVIENMRAASEASKLGKQYENTPVK